MSDTTNETASSVPRPPDPARLARWWAEAHSSLPADAPAAPPATRVLGRTADLSERLIGYIVARSKTGVFSQPEDFPDGRLPRPGEYQVLADFAGEPRCVVRYDVCELLTFAQVGPEHTAIETPALRDLEAWRRFHRNYWEPVLTARGETFREDQPIVFQRFTCLYPSG